MRRSVCPGTAAHQRLVEAQRGGGLGEREHGGEARLDGEARGGSVSRARPLTGSNDNFVRRACGWRTTSTSPSSST